MAKISKRRPDNAFLRQPTCWHSSNRFSSIALVRFGACGRRRRDQIAWLALRLMRRTGRMGELGRRRRRRKKRTGALWRWPCDVTRARRSGRRTRRRHRRLGPATATWEASSQRASERASGRARRRRNSAPRAPAAYLPPPPPFAAYQLGHSHTGAEEENPSLHCTSLDTTNVCIYLYRLLRNNN